MKKVIVIVAVVVLAAAAYGGYWYFTRNGKDQGPKTVVVETGTLTEKALAMGEIIPRHEIAVKSKISGTVARIFVQEGDSVSAGDRLLEVRPDPTPLEYAQAKRTLEMRLLAEEQRRADLRRAEGLLTQGMAPQAEVDRAREVYEQAALQRKMAEEELAIVDRGRAVVAGRTVENIILSPVRGRVLDLVVDVGDPVVPLTSYQPGTELMRLADMEELLFRGTVDEIDVGKVRPGMSGQLKIGAFPDRPVAGHLARISLKSQKRDNATVFEVELDSLVVPEGLVLRAGYSANADIIIRRAEGVPVLPERALVFRGDSTFVRLRPGDPGGQPIERQIEIGMSDGIQVEVKSGLALGDTVLDKETKEIK
ncbi:MAG: efflux RND transporter periplasmic adaptor subunit [Candidatus Latescibacterota bacterium]|jgi:HlyD family secretion protein